MIDIVQWRCCIGSFNSSRSVTTPLNSTISSGRVMACGRLLLSVGVLVIVNLLLIQSGDIETNPGPLTGNHLQVMTVQLFWCYS